MLPRGTNVFTGFTRKQKDQERNRRELASRHFLPFVKYTLPEYEVTWYHKILCTVLEDWFAGKIKRLMLFMPPRHGKSQLVSRHLPAFIFGKNPNAYIISASYGMELAEDMNDDVQKIIDDARYYNVFPQTTLAKSIRTLKSDKKKYKRNSNQFQIVGHKGRYQASAVDSAITGRGFDYGIVDDPIKNRKEAESKTVRDSVLSWYMSTFETRQEGEVPILLTVTRWHEDDLAGKLLDLAKKGGKHALKWKVLNFPALADPDEELHPLDQRKGTGEALWPKKFSRKILQARRATLTGYEWESIYQQHPLPAGGAKIKRTWFKIRDYPPEDLYWSRFWDLAISAKKSADYTASIAGAVDSDGNIYLRDMIRGQWEWPEVKRNIKSTSLREEIAVGIEEGGQQKGFVDDLLADSELMSVSIAGHRPDKDKLTRALPWIARAEAGKIYLINGSWIQEFLNECQLFTGVADKHDDQIDAVSGVYQMISSPPAADFGLEALPGAYQSEVNSIWDTNLYQ